MRLSTLALVTALALSVPTAVADSFDVVTYTAPKGWAKTTANGGLQLSITDAQSGEYALALIIGSTPSKNTPEKNFTTIWSSAVKATVKVATEPAKQPNATKNGWTLVTGGAEFTNGTQKGVALLITATGGGKMTSLIIMTNSGRYQADIEALVGSLDLPAAKGAAPTSATTTKLDRSAIVDKLWEGVTTEKFTSGAMNGYNTGGFFTDTYRFSKDGTYAYTAIRATAWTDNNMLDRETGTYSIDGGQITIVPTSGSTEEWTTVGGPIKVAASSDQKIRAIKEHWGKRVKKSDKKRGKLTFAADVRFLESDKVNALVLATTETSQIFCKETEPSKARPLPPN